MKSIFSILFLLAAFTCLSQETTTPTDYQNTAIQAMADPDMVSSAYETANPSLATTANPIDKNKVEPNQNKDKKTAQNKLNNLKGKRRGGGMNPVTLAVIIIVSAAIIIYLVTSARTTKM